MQAQYGMPSHTAQRLCAARHTRRRVDGRAAVLPIQHVAHLLHQRRYARGEGACVPARCFITCCMRPWVIKRALRLPV